MKKRQKKRQSDLMEYAGSFDFCTAEEKKAVYAAMVRAWIWGLTTR